MCLAVDRWSGDGASLQQHIFLKMEAVSPKIHESLKPFHARKMTEFPWLKTRCLEIGLFQTTFLWTKAESPEIKPKTDEILSELIARYQGSEPLLEPSA